MLYVLASCEGAVRSALTSPNEKAKVFFLNICLYESMFGDAIPFFSANFILESMLIEFQTSLDQKQ